MITPQNVERIEKTLNLIFPELTPTRDKSKQGDEEVPVSWARSIQLNLDAPLTKEEYIGLYDVVRSSPCDFEIKRSGKGLRILFFTKKKEAVPA